MTTEKEKQTDALDSLLLELRWDSIEQPPLPTPLPFGGYADSSYFDEDTYLSFWKIVVALAPEIELTAEKWARRDKGLRIQWVRQALENRQKAYEATAGDATPGIQTLADTTDTSPAKQTTEAAPKADDSTGVNDVDWPTLTDTAKGLEKATSTVSNHLKAGKLRDNGKTGDDRRIDPASILAYCKATGAAFDGTVFQNHSKRKKSPK